MPAPTINMPRLPLFNKGLVTQRNPLVVPISQFATNVVQHHDALIDGLNTELSSLSTLVRRWGLSRYSSSTFGANEFPDLFYLFRNTTGTLRTMTATLGATEAAYQYDPTTLTPIGVTDTALASSHWAMQSAGDYLYVMKGLPTASRWQPDHPVSGVDLFRMGIAAPKEPPTLTVTKLPFNEFTSTPYTDTTILNGKVIVQEESLSIEDYTLAINSDGTLQVSWTYNNYPPSATAPSTDSSQTTPAGTAATVYVDPPNGAAFVSFSLTPISLSTDDIATALINNTSLVVPDYGLPNFTFVSVKAVLKTGAAARAMTLVVAPDAQIVSDIFADQAIIFTQGNKNINTIITFPFVDKDDIITGTVNLDTYVDSALTASVAYGGTDYDIIAGNINAGGFHLAYVEKDGDEWQLVVSGNFPTPSLPATNTTNIVGANTLQANGVPIAPTVQFVNSYAVRPLTGIQFGYVWRNPTTGHVSSMSPPATVDASDAPVFISILTPKSQDPQAPQPELYATADGGSTFALAPQFATFKGTTNWIFAYITPDSYLNEAVQAPLNFANEPPPAGANGLVQHTGRMWAFVDNVLYYSGGPDTSNGLGNEAWPPANNFVYPGKIVKIMSTSFGLLVFLNDDVHVVEGTDKASYFSHIFATNFGISNPNAAVLDAQTVYAYTTAKQLQAFGPGQQTEIGEDIAQDLQDAFNPLTTSLALLRGRSTDHALFISNGVDSMYRWTPTTQSQWSPVGVYDTTGIGVISSTEVAPGDIRLIVGSSGLRSPNTAYIMQRDPSTYADIGVPFLAFAVIGSIQLTTPDLPLLAAIDNIVIQSTFAGSVPLISIALNELNGRDQSLFSQIGVQRQLPDPPTGRFPSTTLRQLRYYTKDSIVPITERGQNVFIRIDWAAEDVRSELLGLYASNGVQ